MTMVERIPEPDAEIGRPGHDLREAVGVFDDLERIQSSVDELLLAGFDRSEISTVASRTTIERQLGRGYLDVSEIEDDLTIPRTVFVSKTSLGDAEGVLIAVCVYVFAVVAAGVMAAAQASSTILILTVIVSGAVGGLIGYYLARRVDQRHARAFREQLEHGGLILWVNLHNVRQEKRAIEILQRHGARHIHVHDVPEPAPVQLSDELKLRHLWPTAWWRP